LAKPSSPLKSQVGAHHPDTSVSPLSLWERVRVRGFAFMALNWLTMTTGSQKLMRYLIICLFSLLSPYLALADETHIEQARQTLKNNP
jgi:hypothetical protein